MPSLLLMTGPQAGLRQEIVGEVVLGRSPSCTIALEDAKVSRRHVRIVVVDGEARVSDLGSRNGTQVNGERIEAEVSLLPGDRLQVGDSTILFEPSVKASLIDAAPNGDLVASPVEELLPAVGTEAGLYNAGVALLSASHEAMVLRRAAEELARGVNAEAAAALLGGVEGLMTAAVVGAESVEVPRALLRASLERKEAARVGGVLCAPLLASGGAPFGILYASRPELFTVAEQRTAAALGRLVGEALAAVRSAREGGAAAWAERGSTVLVGNSKQLRRLIEHSRRASVSTDSVTIIGERGTGRALVASYIHGRSSRALGPLIRVDCRQPQALVDEQLFGRTSAPGVPPASSVILQSDQGTLVLEHLESLPRQSASRLARLIGRGVAPARHGGEESVDVRFLVTASGSLSALAARGELDSDLAKALAGIDVEVAPLRERSGDVAALFTHFATEAARAQLVDAPALSPDALQLMTAYSWPGNVSELEAVAKRLVLLMPGQEVSALQLPPEVRHGAHPQRPTLAELVNRLERDAIAEALREARGKKIKVAAMLGISRPTLDKKIEDYQLTVDKRRDE
jgi:DNA-binding NtrC family response regulator